MNHRLGYATFWVTVSLLTIIAAIFVVEVIKL